jgi:hypothetical protein
MLADVWRETDMCICEVLAVHTLSLPYYESHFWKHVFFFFGFSTLLMKVEKNSTLWLQQEGSKRNYKKRLYMVFTILVGG